MSASVTLIIHDIYKAFETNSSLEAIRVLLDLSKSFDRVWHERLMYKLKCLRICGKFDGIIHFFLSDKWKIVVLNEQSSNWSHIEAGVS